MILGAQVHQMLNFIRLCSAMCSLHTTQILYEHFYCFLKTTFHENLGCFHIEIIYISVNNFFVQLIAIL